MIFSGLKAMAVMPLLLFFLSNSIVSQNAKTKIYKVWVETIDDREISGFLGPLDTLGMNVVADPKSDTEAVYIPANEIRTIKLRRKGSVGKGAGIGLAAGGILGALLAGTEDNSDDVPFGGAVETAVDGVAIAGLSILGTGIGTLTGTAKRKYKIDGKEAMYRLKVPLIRELISKKR